MTAALSRDPDRLRQFLAQGYWLQRVATPRTTRWRDILSWSLALSENGQAAPPLCLVADIGHLALGHVDRGTGSGDALPLTIVRVWRAYDDAIHGPLFRDASFARAAAAIQRLEKDKQPRGVAYLIRQIQENVGIGGIEIPSGVIRDMLQAKPEELSREGWDSLKRDGPTPILVELLEQIASKLRRAHRLLALEDVLALEHRTALSPLADYIAHRQVLRVASDLEAAISSFGRPPSSARDAAPTRILDDDSYPVGGYASLATQGSVESLLHSQLAYMEPDPADRPDLFDIKHLRGELYYYARDENQFHRRRRKVVFVFHPDLASARVKDADAPFQRTIFVLGLLVALCRRLEQWLSDEGLMFEILFTNPRALMEEQRLIESLFREQIENQTCRALAASHDWREQLREQAEVIATSALEIHGVEPDDANAPHPASRLIVDRPRPRLMGMSVALSQERSDTILERWSEIARTILASWR
jgi:hypothetical protein